MSTDSDRIAVPTNGRGPHPLPDAVPPGTSVATTDAATRAATAADTGAPSDEEMSTALSPRQLAVGFGILASLLLLVVGLARRRRPDDPGS